MENFIWNDSMKGMSCPLAISLSIYICIMYMYKDNILSRSNNFPLEKIDSNCGEKGKKRKPISREIRWQHYGMENIVEPICNSLIIRGCAVCAWWNNLDYATCRGVATTANKNKPKRILINCSTVDSCTERPLHIRAVECRECSALLCMQSKRAIDCWSSSENWLYWHIYKRKRTNTIHY